MPRLSSRALTTIRSILVLILAMNGAAMAANAPFQTLNKSLGWPGETLSGNECFGHGQGFGPFDNRDPQISTVGGYGWLMGGSGQSVRELVEGAHFLPVTEQLIRGKRGAVDFDLDYTLRAIPNHHRALWAMSRYYLKLMREVGEEELVALERNTKKLLVEDRNQKVDYPPPECYFHRAKKFAPDDARISVVFGTYLHRRGLLQQALAEYSIAERSHPDDPELMYNLGLLHVDLGNLDKAKGYAQRATELRYPLSGLQRKIKRLEAEASARSDRLN